METRIYISERSEIGNVSSSSCAELILLLEMLVRSEFREEGEKNMERLDGGLLILQLVHRDVYH